MPQTGWENAAGLGLGGVCVISARQREWLAALPDDCVAVIAEQDPDSGLLGINATCWQPDEDVWEPLSQDEVPWEGFIDQPRVKIDDAGFHDLPTTDD